RATLGFFGKLFKEARDSRSVLANVALAYPRFGAHIGSAAFRCWGNADDDVVLKAVEQRAICCLNASFGGNCGNDRPPFVVHRLERSRKCFIWRRWTQQDPRHDPYLSDPDRSQ